MHAYDYGRVWIMNIVFLFCFSRRVGLKATRYALFSIIIIVILVSVSLWPFPSDCSSFLFALILIFCSFDVHCLFGLCVSVCFLFCCCCCCACIMFNQSISVTSAQQAPRIPAATNWWCLKSEYQLKQGNDFWISSIFFSFRFGRSFFAPSVTFSSLIALAQCAQCTERKSQANFRVFGIFVCHLFAVKEIVNRLPFDVSSMSSSLMSAWLCGMLYVYIQFELTDLNCTKCELSWMAANTHTHIVYKCLYVCCLCTDRFRVNKR